MKKFSILMPTSLSPARSQYILEAIEAIRQQTYTDWELIIKAHETSADLSTLHGLDLKNITVILNTDRGITDAMNQCLRFSTGDIFIWANDDDKLMPDALETIANEIGNYQWGFGKMVTDRGEVGTNCNYSQMKQGNLICQPTVFWTREAYKYLGSMDEYLDLVSDYEYWCRLMRTFPHKYINKVLAYYRLHPDQITTKITHEQLRQANMLKATL